ncbi:MAG: hypothetical protein HOV81_20245 [Kofleriaceae bacterium]|nr:hypothetical protein [Kofleriaceae bacterium]
MTYPALGFWLIFETPLLKSDRVTNVAELLTDPRWPWQPSLVRPMPSPGEGLYPWPGGKIAAKALRGAVEDVIRSDSATGIYLSTSRQDAGNHVFLIVDNGTPRTHKEGRIPYTALGLCRYPVPPGKSIDAWLALVRELATVLEAKHGVIWVDADERYIIARQFVSGSPRPREAPDHPGNESYRIIHARRDLGERYVRFPGWATFLRSAHVDAIGGREKLLATVNPPVVHDVGDLLYLQLSASVDDALSDETQARRRALIELLTPIIVPLAPARPAA